MKKVLVFLMVLCSLFVFASCKETEYSLEVTVLEKVFVGEKSNYLVKVMPDNTEIAGYAFSSSDEQVFTVSEGTITGVNAGKAFLTVSMTYQKQELEEKISVEVFSKEEVNYELSLSISDELFVGDVVSFDVKENLTSTVITDFDVFFDKDGIARFENGKLVCVSEGTFKMTVTTLFEGKQIKIQKEIVIQKKIETNYELELSLISNIKVGDSAKIALKEKTTNKVITDYTVSLSNDNAKYENGSVFGLKAGNVTLVINTTFNNKELSIEKEIVIVALEQSELSCNILPQVYAGSKQTVKVFYSEEKIEVFDFSITVVNDDICYYDEDNNVFEAFSAGTTKIIIEVTYAGENYKLEHLVEIMPGFDLRVEVSPEVYEKEEYSIKVFLLPDNIEITDFTSSSNNADLLLVEGDTFKALARGKSRIVIRYTHLGIELIKSIEITVLEKIENKLVVNLYDYMFLNENKELDVKLFPYNEIVSTFTVQSSNTSVIECSNNVLIAKSKGTSQITIKCTVNENSFEENFQVTVYDFTDISLEVENSLFMNEVKKYIVKAMPSGVLLKDFTYSTSNDSYLCNSNALFGVNSGEAELTVSYDYLGKKYTKSQAINVLEIVHEVERLFVSGPEGILVDGKTEITISAYPENIPFTVTIKSDNEDICVVGTGDLNKNIYTYEIISKAQGKCQLDICLESNPLVATMHKLTVISKNDESIVEGMVGTTPYKGRYYEESVLHYYELMNNVIETSYIGYTSTLTSGIDADGYSGVTEPIVVDKYYPQAVHTLTIPSSTDTKIIPWANLTGHKWTLATVKSLITDFESKNPQYKVIAAVNGDFFDINANKNLPYQTTGENISDGEFYKTTSDFSAAGGTLGFTNNGTSDSLIAKYGAQRTQYMILAIYDDNGNIVKEYDIHNLNSSPSENQTSIFYGTYSSNKDYVPQTIPNVTGNQKVFVVDNAELALPNNAIDFYGLGVVSSLEEKELPIGSFGIVTSDPQLISDLSLNVRIRCQFEFTGDFAEVTSATGYNNVIYTDVNQLGSYIADRAPRTVIGKRADGTIVMMVVDGRQGYDNMYGCDGTELAAIMKAYGCVSAYNVDGGGSSTIVVRDDSGLHVLNSPSDGRERNDGNCLLIVTLDPNYQTTVSDITKDSAVISISTETDEFKDYTPCIQMNGKMYEAVDGKVVLENLVHNTTYSFRVYYKDSDGEYHITLGDNTFKTQKANFKFLGVTLKETDTYYEIYAYSDDIDNAGDVKEMTVNINGFVTYLKNGYLKLEKSIYGSVIKELSFSYRFDDEGKRKVVTVDGDSCFKY